MRASSADSKGRGLPAAAQFTPHPLYPRESRRICLEQETFQISPPSLGKSGEDRADIPINIINRCTSFDCFVVPCFALAVLSSFHIDCPKKGTRAIIPGLECMRSLAKAQRLVPALQVSHRTTMCRTERCLDPGGLLLDIEQAEEGISIASLGALAIMATGIDRCPWIACLVKFTGKKVCLQSMVRSS